MRDVQQALKDRGFAIGPVDGEMSPNTQEALRDFQRRNGLAATGELNQETLAALNITAGGAGTTGSTSSSSSPSGTGTSAGSSTGSSGSMTTPPVTR